MKLMIALIFLLGAVGITFAQECDHNLPCGRVPWDMPQFPPLSSPTRIPTMVATAVSGSVPTSTPNPTPSATGTAIYDPSELSDQLATLQSIANATPMNANNPYNPANFGENTSMFFGYVRGVSTLNFGVFTPIIAMIFFAFFFWLGLKVLFFILPVIAALIGLVRKGIQLVLDFLPG